MSFQSFLTGFLGEMNRGMEEREAQANNYFEKKFEMASTEGRAKLKQMRANHAQAAKITQALVDKGVPSSILSAAINDDPANLETIYKFWETNASKGIEISPEQWEQTFQVIGDVAGEEMTPFQVLEEAYTPYSSFVEKEPEAVRRDPPGALFRSLLGFDSLEKAQRKLDTTEMEDGMTISDLLDLNPNDTSSPLGGARINYDPTKFAQENKSTALSDAAMRSLTNSWDSDVARAMENNTVRKQFNDMWTEQGNDLDSTGAVVAYRKFSENIVAESWRDMYDPDILQQLPFMYPYMQTEEPEKIADETVQVLESTPAIETTELPPASAPASTPAPTDTPSGTVNIGGVDVPVTMVDDSNPEYTIFKRLDDGGTIKVAKPKPNAKLQTGLGARPPRRGDVLSILGEGDPTRNIGE